MHMLIQMGQFSFELLVVLHHLWMFIFYSLLLAVYFCLKCDLTLFIFSQATYLTLLHLKILVSFD